MAVTTASVKTVLVTGAGSGIGAATARHLAASGNRVFAGIRGTSDTDFPAGFDDESITAVPLDVTCPSQIDNAAAIVSDHLAREGRCLWGLVNCAGIDHHAPLELTPRDVARAQLDVNALGVLSVTQAFLPMLRESRGRIVNIGSVHGHSVARGAGAHAAAKHALEAYSATFRLELAPWNISVSIVELGAVHTPMWEKALTTFKALPRDLAPDALRLYFPDWEASLGRAHRDKARHERRAVAPARVARVIAHALFSGRPRQRYLVGWDARLYAMAERLFPHSWLDRIMQSVYTDQDPTPR